MTEGTVSSTVLETVAMSDPLWAFPRALTSVNPDAAVALPRAQLPGSVVAVKERLGPSFVVVVEYLALSFVD